MKATFTLAPGVARREVLGADDVTDAELEAMVADLWDVPAVRLLDSTAEPVDYDAPSILTGARTWVRGHATTGTGSGTEAEGREFTLFVKRVHNWRHSPAFADVPPEVGAWAATSVPWRAEPLVYGSDLRERLPEGLSMPRGLRVEERPDETAVVWIEAVPTGAEPWDREAYVEAAGLLGRMSGSPRVAELAAIDPLPWHIQYFVQGRLVHTVLPGLFDDATWDHELVAPYFGDLRGRLTAVAGHLDPLAEEFAAMPHRTSHGDACPNNLLRHPSGTGFTLIDFGFWQPLPAGADLSQLLIGDVQIGRSPAGDLTARDDAHLAEYVRGLRDEGCGVPEPVVRRAHALHMLMMSGLSAVPVEELDRPPSPSLEAQVADRVKAASAEMLDKHPLYPGLELT